MASPKFVLNRDFVLSSTLGHTLEFKKGEPIHVPKEMWSAVQAIGAIPEEDLPEEKIADTKEPLDVSDRKLLIMAAFEQLVMSNKRENFAGTGVPHNKALAAILGFTLDAKERDLLWQEFRLAVPKGE